MSSPIEALVPDRHNKSPFDSVEMTALMPLPQWKFTEGNYRDNIWEEIARIDTELNLNGFVFTSDEALGFGADFREGLVSNYFSTDLIRRHEGDEPKDRERARDVIRYSRVEGHETTALLLGEHTTATIFDRDVQGTVLRERRISRIETLRDKQFATFLATTLTTMPDALQMHEGTYGVNFFRTHSNVVSKPHHDREALIIIYVVDIAGADVVNRLITDSGQAGVLRDIAGHNPPFRDKVLRPGDMLYFLDDAFAHDVVGSLGEGARRDALVLTLDYPSTYEIYGEPGSPEWDWR